MTVVVRFTDTIDLPIGGTCQVELSVGRYNAHIIGYVESKVALLSPPPPGSEFSPLPEGRTVTIRFNYRGSPYGFETKLLKKYTTPAPVWVFAYPDRFRSLSVRTTERITTFIPCALTRRNGETVSGALMNISADGALFSADEGELRAGEKPILSVTFPNGKPITGLTCDVRYAERQEGKLMAGFMIHDKRGPGFAEFQAYYQLVAGKMSVPKSVQAIYPV
jgi:c-di-GMP-binding flagellar brake protein YcgR